MKPPHRCAGCQHWSLFPVDGKCCTDLEVVLARQAEGLRKRQDAEARAPAPSAHRAPRLAATPILAPRAAVSGPT